MSQVNDNNPQESEFEWLTDPVAAIDQEALALAKSRQAQLTKPPGSLGRLETLALQFAGWQGSESPRLERICVRVFAADHGVCAQGVSAFPQVVTTQMIANFLTGGAAISVLCRQLRADFGLYSLGTVHPLPELDNLNDCTIAAGTQDFTRETAMSAQQLSQALLTGAEALPLSTPDLFIGGEMGIGNTTSASALFSALIGLSPSVTAGPGTGVDAQGVEHKSRVIEQGLQRHQAAIDEGGVHAALRCLGGFEIAALVGAYISSAQCGIPVLVDGFISTAAALCAVRLNPGVADWMLFAHRSAEPAHQLALQEMGAEPLLDLQMRLGEGSGAAVAVPLLQAALALHNGMATFEDAGVSGGDSSDA